MKYKLNIFFALLLIVFLTGIVFADIDNKTNAKNDSGTENKIVKNENVPIKNMTLGQCVSENAKLKNTCFKNAQEILKVCKNQVSSGNITDKKEKKVASKLCSQTYKKDLTQCKVVFKEGKKECTKIKQKNKSK